MSQNASKPAAEWLNYSAKVPLRALCFERADFKRLYTLISDKQQETKAYHLSNLAKMPNETDEQFVDRRQRVDQAFVVSVTIHGFNQKLFTGNSADIFDSPNLPEKIRSIFYSTESVPAALLAFKPSNKIVVFLDFSKPPMLDLARLPTWPTPNESSFAVDGDNNGWCTSSTAVLTEFFDNRSTKQSWLHAAGIYDMFLFIVGLPISIWIAYKASLVANPLSSHPILINAICVYAFFVSLFFYRFMFTYARWVFPKIEYKGHSSSLSHRAIWGAITLSIVCSLIYDVGKAVFYQVH